MLSTFCEKTGTEKKAVTMKGSFIIATGYGFLLWLPVSVFGFSLKKIKINGDCNNNQKTNQGSCVYHGRINILSSDPVRIIFYKRVGKIGLSQFLFYIPLPLGDGTITPAEPNAKNKPGKRRGRHQDQMGFSQWCPYPAKEVESN
jgi:hypothetical protein